MAACWKPHAADALRVAVDVPLFFGSVVALETEESLMLTIMLPRGEACGRALEHSAAAGEGGDTGAGSGGTSARQLFKVRGS